MVAASHSERGSSSAAHFAVCPTVTVKMVLIQALAKGAACSCRHLVDASSRGVLAFVRHTAQHPHSRLHKLETSVIIIIVRMPCFYAFLAFEPSVERTATSVPTSCLFGRRTLSKAPVSEQRCVMSSSAGISIPTSGRRFGSSIVSTIRDSLALCATMNAVNRPVHTLEHVD